MKKLILIIAAVAISHATVSAQGCLPEGITFTTQSQIDNFQINYPGCTQIEGNVIISDNYTENITNLNGLIALTSIGENLVISYNGLLTSLAGLENVTSIGGDLSIEGRSLPDMTGLQGLTSIGGDLWIFFTTSLTSLTGLENVTSIGGDLGIWYNASLTSLTGLENVTSIGGDLGITSNAALTSLTGLENVTSIGGDLIIWGNAALSDCAIQSICEYLASPNGSVSINDNAVDCNNPTEVADVCGISLPCLPYGNYYFNTQSDIDNFQINYPGCAEIEGNVGISGSNIINLNGLNIITSIGGSLWISYNNSLPNLTGLDNLTSIGGFLSIYYNDSLTNLTGLDNLTSIGGGVSIYRNNSLTSLIGLNGLTSIAGYLHFGENTLEGLVGNPALTSLTGLDNLTSIGGEVSIRGNNSLTNLTGLENVTSSIGGDLTIYSNAALTSLTGLENVTSIEGDLTIYSNPALSGCAIQSICDYLASPNGIVNIYNNAADCNTPPEVADVCGISMPCLPFGNYSFLSQADIDNFQINYPDCNVLEGDVTISGVDITDLDELINVTSIGGDLTVQGNPVLNDLTGLDNLGSVGSDLNISGNDSLTTLIGLGSLTTIGGDATISDNYHFNDFIGLDNLNFIGGGLFIWDDHALTSLTGLGNLTSVGGNLELLRNYILQNFLGLEGLLSIGGELLISENNALTSLDGLNNINAASIANLYVEFNNSLSQCEVKSICEYLVNPNGYILIGFNAPGCNSQAEVEDACGIIGVEEISHNNGFSIYPNPSTSQITIETSTEHIPGRLSILNLSGQQLIQCLVAEPVTVVDISYLPGGVYVVRVTNDRMVETTKLIKQ
jgi:hypothetical protein